MQPNEELNSSEQNKGLLHGTPEILKIISKTGCARDVKSVL